VSVTEHSDGLLGPLEASCSSRMRRLVRTPNLPLHPKITYYFSATHIFPTLEPALFPTCPLSRPCPTCLIPNLGLPVQRVCICPPPACSTSVLCLQLLPLAAAHELDHVTSLYSDSILVIPAQSWWHLGYSLGVFMPALLRKASMHATLQRAASCGAMGALHCFRYMLSETENTVTWSAFCQ